MTMQTPGAGGVDSVWSRDNIVRRKSRAMDIDRHVGARMRERRIALGMTQHQMAEAIFVTYQQAHKYEKGINRVAAGRLYKIAQALGVDVSYFFEGLGNDKAFKATERQRSLLSLTNSYNQLTREDQDIVNTLVHKLAKRDG